MSRSGRDKTMRHSHTHVPGLVRLAIPAALLFGCSDDSAVQGGLSDAAADAQLDVATDQSVTASDGAEPDVPEPDLAQIDAGGGGDGGGGDAASSDRGGGDVGVTDSGPAEGEPDTADGGTDSGGPSEDPGVDLFTADGGIGSVCEYASDCLEGLVCVEVCTADVECESNTPCGPGGICGDDGVCVPNITGGECTEQDDCIRYELCASRSCVRAGCDAEVYTAEEVPPNMLIVFDRSSSMNQNDKWDIGREAVADVVEAYGDQIYFGLNFFPGEDQSCDEGEECGAGLVNIDVGPGTADAITDYMEDADTCSFGTPIAEVLSARLDYPAFDDVTRASYIMLVTDGMSTCNNPVPVVEALRERDPEVRTFVVGFGGGVDPDELEAMAEEGGTARDGDPAYYQADDAESLEEGFATIAGSIVSCNYALSDEPPDSAALFVYFDGVEVMRDDTRAEGWTYSGAAQRIDFYGSACTSLQDGDVEELLVVYGCPVVKE